MSAALLAFHIGTILFLPPLLLGVIGKTKATLTGRIGAPLLQPYHDLWKLLRKSAVYSGTTSVVFRLAPVAALAAMLTAALFVPIAGRPSLVSFPGDLILWVYLLGLARFAIVVAALDTGSSFEGMGASREVTFSSLVEPALLIALAVVATLTHSLRLEEMFGSAVVHAWYAASPALALVVASLFIAMLAENARVPVDDPLTHLELTMIHEVMVLDHGGPDLGFILYGSAVKLFLFGALLVRLVCPFSVGGAWRDGAVFIAGLLVLAVMVGLVESAMARLRLVRVPQFVVTAFVLALVGMLLTWG